MKELKENMLKALVESVNNLRLGVTQEEGQNYVIDAIFEVVKSKIDKITKRINSEFYDSTELRIKVEKLQAENEAQQYKIDELMLEYCPDDMTPEQIEEWGRNQKPTEESK